MVRKYDIHFEANKEPVFSCTNFKTSINRMTCENIFCVSVHISSENLVEVICVKNKYIDRKELKASLLSTSFHQVTSRHFILNITKYLCTQVHRLFSLYWEQGGGWLNNFFLIAFFKTS